MDELLKIQEEALAKIAACADAKELNDLRVFYLGKKGPIQAAMKSMKTMAPEERKTFGQVSNKTKQEIGQAIEEKKAYLEEKALNERLLAEDIDISLPGNRLPVGSVHPLTRVKEDLEELFLGMGYKVAEGPEVESDHFNFELMNLPKGHPARDMQDTFYIDENTLIGGKGKGDLLETFIFVDENSYDKPSVKADKPSRIVDSLTYKQKNGIK